MSLWRVTAKVLKLNDYDGQIPSTEETEVEASDVSGANRAAYRYFTQTGRQMREILSTEEVSENPEPEDDREENPRTVPTTEVEHAGYGDRMMRCVGHPEYGVKTLSQWIKFVGGDREAEPTFEWRDDGGFEVIIPARTGRVVLREIDAMENPRTVPTEEEIKRDSICTAFLDHGLNLYLKEVRNKKTQETLAWHEDDGDLVGPYFMGGATRDLNVGYAIVWLKKNFASLHPLVRMHHD